MVRTLLRSCEPPFAHGPIFVRDLSRGSVLDQRQPCQQRFASSKLELSTMVDTEHTYNAELLLLHHQSQLLTTATTSPESCGDTNRQQ